MINWALVFTLVVTSNVLLTNGFGAISLQRSKNNQRFTLLNCLFMTLSMVAIVCIYGLIYVKLLDPYNVENLGIIIIVALCGAFGFASLYFTKLISKELYYYYDSTYSFVINLATSVGVVLCVDFTDGYLEGISYSLFIVIGYIIVSLLFSLTYDRLASKKISRNVRPVPITILTIAVLAMVIYAITTSL